jgi:hypothetical protein
MSEEEMVEVKLKLPKAVMDLLRALEKDPTKYLEYSIMDAIRADLDAGILTDPETLNESLKLAFKHYGVLLD